MFQLKKIVFLLVLASLLISLLFSGCSIYQTLDTTKSTSGTNQHSHYPSIYTMYPIYDDIDVSFFYLKLVQIHHEIYSETHYSDNRYLLVDYLIIEDYYQLMNTNSTLTVRFLLIDDTSDAEEALRTFLSKHDSVFMYLDSEFNINCSSVPHTLTTMYSITSGENVNIPTLYGFDQCYIPLVQYIPLTNDKVDLHSLDSFAQLYYRIDDLPYRYVHHFSDYIYHGMSKEILANNISKLYIDITSQNKENK